MQRHWFSSFSLSGRLPKVEDQKSSKSGRGKRRQNLRDQNWFDLDPA